MFLSLVYAATPALLLLHSFVYASPVVGQGVWNPPITTPREGDVWTIGSTQLVTWSTDTIPPSAANNIGTLLLGYFDGDGRDENLDNDHPLATGFHLTDGFVRIQVPDVKPRDTYIVVLMGNSGNASPPFRITKPRSKSGSAHRPSGKTATQKGSGDLDSKQSPPGFIPPGIPDFLSPNPSTGPIESQPLPEDAPASTLCKGRLSSPRSSGSQSQTHDAVPGSGRSGHC